MTATATATKTATVTKRGRQIEFKVMWTDDYCLRELRRFCDEHKNDFAGSLVAFFSRMGKLTKTQWQWAHYLVHCDRHGRPVRPDTAPSPLESFSKIIELFDLAFENGLKYPRLVYSPTGDEDPLVLRRCGAKSRYMGEVNLSNPVPYGTLGARWYGRIARGGTLLPSHDCTPAIVELLAQLASDPAAAARAHGQRTGVCMFCARALTDSRSLSVSYGPICASRFGLPWGDDGDDGN